jgi:hypothetical protein
MPKMCLIEPEGKKVPKYKTLKFLIQVIFRSYTFFHDTQKLS